MDNGLLSLKWNNHSSTFFDVLETIRKKGLYSDVTIACDGKYFEVHKLVLSTCSDYFHEMFERTQCKHPIVVLKDISQKDLEFLLNYMYVGEVNVLQNELSSLIKAAECLRVKGLAVPDEPPSRKSNKRPSNSDKEDNSSSKRNRKNNINSSSDKNSSITRTDVDDGGGGGAAAAAAAAAAASTAISNLHPSDDSNNKNLGSDSQSTTFKEFEPLSVKEEKIDPPATTYAEDGLSDLVKFEPFDVEPEDRGGASNIGNNNDSSYSSHLQPGQDDSMSHVMPSTSGFGESSSWSGDIETIDDDDDDMGGEAGNYDPNSFLDPSQANSQMAYQPQQLASNFLSVNLSAQLLKKEDQYMKKENQYWKCTFQNCSYKNYDRSQLRKHEYQRWGDSSNSTCINPTGISEQFMKKDGNCWKCSYHMCHYKCYDKSDLRKHVRTHTGERPYACSQCYYRAKDKSTLKRHTKFRHCSTSHHYLT